MKAINNYLVLEIIKEPAKEVKGFILTEKLVEGVDRRTKTMQDEVRAMIDKENDRNNTLRDRINSRMDSLDESLTNKMKSLEDQTKATIKKALDNPLSNMRR